MSWPTRSHSAETRFPTNYALHALRLYDSHGRSYPLNERRRTKLTRVEGRNYSGTRFTAGRVVSLPPSPEQTHRTVTVNGCTEWRPPLPPPPLPDRRRDRSTSRLATARPRHRCGARWFYEQFRDLAYLLRSRAIIQAKIKHSFRSNCPELCAHDNGINKMS